MTLVQVSEPEVDAIATSPSAPRHLPSRGAAREARRRATAEMRRVEGWSKMEARVFYARLVHHDLLRQGRAVVDALGMMGR